MNWRKKSTKHCADVVRERTPLWAACALSVMLVGCNLLPSEQKKKEVEPAAKPTPQIEAPKVEPSRPGAPRVVKLGAPETPRSMAHAREQAARRMVAASPDQSYTGAAPPVLLAIPVLTIELNADGSIRRIEVMRYPSQARDTVQLAIQAVRRAAPFGNVSKLPKPWKFNETFLFNDQRQFKPMTLDRR